LNRLVHEIGKAWGAYMRRVPEGFPPRSLMARIHEEGSVGAAIKSHYQTIPVSLMPKSIQGFHRGWLTLRESQRAAVFVCYVVRAPYGEKADKLGISKSRYYQLRDLGLHAIAGMVDFQ
jgi:hypothetical protein